MLRRQTRGRFLYAGIVLVAVGLTAVAVLVVTLVRTQSSAVLADMPLQPSIAVTLERAGPKLVQVEAPRGTDVTPLEVSIRDADTGARLNVEAVWFRMHQAGFSTVRLSIAQFRTAQPGRFLVELDGIRALPSATRMRIVEDYRRRLVATIVGLVLSGLVTVAGLVLTLILWRRA